MKKSAIEIEHERVMKNGTTKEKLDHAIALANGMREAWENIFESIEKSKKENNDE